MGSTIDVDLSLETRAGPASLPNEGVFWFLLPLFDDLANSHGKRIDLYGDVEFRLSELALIDRLIQSARSRCAEMPNSWNQSVGRHTMPKPEQKLRVRVSKDDVVSWLSAIARVVVEARDARVGVRFVGD